VCADSGGPHTGDATTAHSFNSPNETLRKMTCFARSATRSRSSSSIGQEQTARPNRCTLEKGQQPGPRMGSKRTVMPRKRYKPEEIVAKLRQVDVLVRRHDCMMAIAFLISSRTIPSFNCLSSNAL
jgi:hypothetical protein